jgi:hypothetical protein
MKHLKMISPTRPNSNEKKTASEAAGEEKKKQKSSKNVLDPYL